MSNLSHPHDWLKEDFRLSVTCQRPETCLDLEPKPALIKSFFSNSFHLFPLPIPIDIAIANILG
jgi:hypothetical protein